MDLMSLVEVPIAWILVTVHSLLEPFFGSGPGPAWPLAIVGLTIVIRILIIPLFFKQIKASRGMQLLQPDLQALQKKYKGKTDPVSRQAQQQEMAALYKKHNTNPMSSCLPLLVQMPIFFGLFNVLRALGPISDGTYKTETIGPLTSQLAHDALNSTVFGAPLSATFVSAGNFDNSLTIQIVTMSLILVMSAAQFFSMRQLTMKNMPASSMDNPMFKQQQMMMYAMPVIFMVSGVAFQVGLLTYWTVSNFWSIGQQLYTIRRHPAPGSDAYKAKAEREAARRERKGLPPVDDDVAKPEEVTHGQRVQPMGKNRAKKKGTSSDERSADESSADEPQDDDAELAAADSAPDTSEEGEVRGKDGLTEAERAQRRYEQRAAERKAAREKRQAAEKKRQTEQDKGRYNAD